GAGCPGGYPAVRPGRRAGPERGRWRAAQAECRDPGATAYRRAGQGRDGFGLRALPAQQRASARGVEGVPRSGHGPRDGTLQAGAPALKRAGGQPLKPNDVTPSQLLTAALGKGATASVCALYLPNSGHPQEALKAGIGVAKPDAMARAMLKSGRKVFSF